MRPVLGRGRLNRVHRVFAGGEIEALGHVAGGEHTFRARLQMLIDEHAVLGLDPAPFEEADIRRDADGEHDQMSVDPLAVIQHHGLVAVLCRSRPRLRRPASR